MSGEHKYSYAVKGIVYLCEYDEENFTPGAAFECFQIVQNLLKHYVDWFLPKSHAKAAILRLPKMKIVADTIRKHLNINEQMYVHICNMTEIYDALTVHSRFRVITRYEYAQLHNTAEDVVNWFFDNLTAEMKRKLVKELRIKSEDDWLSMKPREFKEWIKFYTISHFKL